VPAPKSFHAEVDSSTVSTGVDLLNRRPQASLHAQHAGGSSPRIVAEAYQWPELDDRAAPAERAPAPRHEYLRIDPADQRPVRGAARRQPNHSLAARAYRWHTTLAPHAGVAATVVLILSATMLYWFTIGQGRNGGAYEDILDHQNSWSSDAPLQSRIAVDERPIEASRLSVDFAAPSPEFPRVAEAPAEPSLSAAQPSGQPPEAAGEAPASADTSSADQESAAVTPTPNAAPYPVTEYVSLDLALPGAVEPVVVAEPPAAEVAAEPAAGAVR
jgi:hypothetical protein